jgi:hypothetical protein
MLSKKITIAYLPGYGGNFLESLFSLDSSTAPRWKINAADTPISRVNSFIELRYAKKIVHLGDYEFKNATDGVSQYQYIFQAIHPEEFDFQQLPDQIFLVDLDWSNFSNYWLMESKKSFDYQLARLRPTETKKNLQIKKIYNTKIINLNCFLDPAQWKDEYQKINQQLGLPNHFDAADKLYRFWYDLRIKQFVNSYITITPDQHALYCCQRLKEEIWGTPNAWQVFYERVRDPQWPDCNQEKDFILLPESIQQELITVFGYQPQNNTSIEIYSRHHRQK